jgi:hypothetical protein
MTYSLVEGDGSESTGSMVRVCTPIRSCAPLVTIQLTTTRASVAAKTRRSREEPSADDAASRPPRQRRSPSRRAQGRRSRAVRRPPPVRPGPDNERPQEDNSHEHVSRGRGPVSPVLTRTDRLIRVLFTPRSGRPERAPHNARPSCQLEVPSTAGRWRPPTARRQETYRAPRVPFEWPGWNAAEMPEAPPGRQARGDVDDRYCHQGVTVK